MAWNFDPGVNSFVVVNSTSTSKINKLILVNSTSVATSAVDGFITFWSTSPTYALTLRMNSTHAGSVQTLCLINSNYMASGGDDNKIFVWNLNTLQKVITFSGHAGSVNDITRLDNSAYLASASTDQTVKIWSWSNGSQVSSISVGYPVLCALQVSKNLIATGVNGTSNLLIWYLDTGTLYSSVAGAMGSILYLRLYDTNIIMAGDQPGYVFFYNLASAKILLSFLAQGFGVRGMSISSDGKVFTTTDGSPTAYVKIWTITKNDFAYTSVNPYYFLLNNLIGVSIEALSPATTPLLSGKLLEII